MLGKDSTLRIISILKPAAAAPTFMNKYHMLKPALRERFVVNLWQADWKTVWMAAVKGAIKKSRALATSPRWGKLGVNPTIRTAALKTSRSSIETFNDFFMPNQSVYIPEMKSINEVAEVNKAVE